MFVCSLICFFYGYEMPFWQKPATTPSLNIQSFFGRICLVGNVLVDVSVTWLFFWQIISKKILGNFQVGKQCDTKLIVCLLVAPRFNVGLRHKERKIQVYHISFSSLCQIEWTIFVHETVYLFTKLAGKRSWERDCKPTRQFSADVDHRIYCSFSIWSEKRGLSEPWNNHTVLFCM